MSKIIVIANHKGGVAKTTTAINLGAALALEGRGVLLVDVDPQCNLTDTLLEEAPDDTVYTAMAGAGEARPVRVKENLWVLAGDRSLNGADYEFAAVKDKQLLLRKALEPLRGRFDYILVDTPPSKQILTLNGLSAADEVIIPVQAEILAVRGLKEMADLVELVRQRINPALKVRGLLLTMYDDRANAAKKTAVYISEAAKLIGTKAFLTCIRRNVAVVESQMSGTDLFTENPKAKAAQNYADLAREFLEGESGR